MGNHDHRVLHTCHANLSRLTRHVNGITTQAFNRRHAKVGHLFQGRFKAILLDREAHLLDVCRHVDLNPDRVGPSTRRRGGTPRRRMASCSAASRATRPGVGLPRGAVQDRWPQAVTCARA